MTEAPTPPAPRRTIPDSSAPKRLFIQTYGCQANVYDSTRMVDVLAPHGYKLVDAADGADLVIINTCHIREKATEKLYSDLGRLRMQRDPDTNCAPARTIVVAGCVAQAEGGEIVRRAPIVDFVVGPQSYHRLPELLARATGERFLGDFTPEEKFDALPAPTASGVTGYLAVQEGCDKFCTFCVVPYTRGAEWSRPLAQVEAEARALAALGVREITLLGQNVNAWHGAGPSGEDSSFDVLLRALANIETVERLRYTTSHPVEMTDALIDLHGTEPKMMPYLHLPVQSGSDRVLRAMNRRHTAADYLRTIERLRAVRPDMAISTDLIVGFPGESDAEFEETLALVAEVKFCAAYSFKYSRRAGTPAAGLARQVAEDIADERLQRLQALLREQQLAFNAAHIGRTMPVLVTGPGRHVGQMLGKSPYHQSVHFDGDAALVGQIVDVSISGAGLNSVSGDVVRTRS